MKKNSDIRFMRGISAEKLEDVFGMRTPMSMQYINDTPAMYHTRVLCDTLKARTTTDLLSRTMGLLCANLELAKGDRPRLPAWALPLKLKLLGLLIGRTAKYPKRYFQTGVTPVNKAWACHAIHMAVVDWAATMSARQRAENTTAAGRLADRLERNVLKCLNFWAEKKMPLKIRRDE